MTTYFINDPLGVDIGYGTGSITGTITFYPYNPQFTGGPTWDLTATIGSQSYEFTPLNSGTIDYGGFIQDGNELLFNFAPGNGFFFSTGQGSGTILGWQSGCNVGDGCGLAVAQIGYQGAWSTPHDGIAPIGYAVPSPIAGVGISGLLVLALIWGWRRI